VEIVGSLARQLGRPVCSDDLALFFRKHPADRPVALKPLGAQLAHAARPLSGVVPFLREIGLIGNRRYYAPDEAPYWHLKFQACQGEIVLLSLSRWSIPQRLEYLLEEGTWAPLAEKALAGWAAEVEWITHRFAIPVPVGLLRDWEWARSFGKFSPGTAPRLVSRSTAGALLQNEHRRRTESPFPLSLNRHLALLRWPQCKLFPEPGEPSFWETQLRLYATVKWPLPDEDPLLAAGLFACSRYGLAGRAA